MSHCKCQRWRGGEAATLLAVSSCRSSLPLLPLMLLYSCHQHPAPGPGFTPPCACESTCSHAHTSHHPLPPPPPYMQPIWLCTLVQRYAGRERAEAPRFIFYPNYPISPLLVSHRKCTEGSHHKRLRLGKGACIINHTYISHLFKERGAALGLTEAELRLL